MALTYHEIVDCIVLHLELDFFLLNQQKLNALGDFLLQRTFELLKDAFFTRWDFNDRHVKPEALSSKILSNTKLLRFSFEGDVFSDIVFDLKSFKRYDRIQRDMNIITPWPASYDKVSADYPVFFAKYFGNMPLADKCKEALLHVFNESNRKKLARWRDHDVGGIFFSHRHENYPDLYWGEFEFKIAYSCLGSHGISVSEKIAETACQIARDYTNVNARVALTPMWFTSPCSGHMKYFGILPNGFFSSQNNFNNHECRTFFYSRGAEWVNILSPLQLSHIHDFEGKAKKYPQISVETFAGGGKSVRLNKCIDQVDVIDLADIKKLLYDALWPGESTMPFKYLFDPNCYMYRTKPRPEWERVPIFEDEITVFEDRIVFQHKQNIAED